MKTFLLAVVSSFDGKLGKLPILMYNQMIKPAKGVSRLMIGADIHLSLI